MKKIFIVLTIIGCSQKKIQTKKIEKITEEDTMICEFANQVKLISKEIQLKNLKHKKYKDSLSNQIKNLHRKNAHLIHDNNFYLDAIDQYSNIVNTKQVQDVVFKDSSK